jgi:tetratricopeptide (TPR) repeat protein
MFSRGHVTTFALLAAGVWALGCGRDESPADRPPAPPAPAVQVPGDAPPPGQPLARPAAWSPDGNPAEPLPVAERSPQEKYDAALLDALNLLAGRKYGEALDALQSARAVQDTEQIRAWIDKVKKLQEQQAAAEQTVADIKTVLDEGKGDEAGRLAAQGLQQYGGGDTAAALGRLKREADALVLAAVNDDQARRDRLRHEADDALRDKNLRAAAIALEQLLACGEDDAVRRQLDDVRSALGRYDDNRRRAAELRQDPAGLEDALAALQQAAEAWDTLQVRAEIEEYNLALQKRRDRLSVADFELRGDVDPADLGRTVGEELLAAFKGRFDLVERGQLGKLIEELKLGAGDLLDGGKGRAELGRLAKVRYLVVGSITRLSGLLVQTRLVDVRTGLIVQTARVVAATPEELLTQLPQLAAMLQMSDEEKRAYEQKLASQPQPTVPVAEPGPLPPPPPLPTDDQPAPPPVLVSTSLPPAVGQLRPEDFDALPAAPPADQPLPDVVVGERDEPVRRRALRVCVELGDDLFRRGRYREAHHQFELALGLSRNDLDVQIRIDRCRAYLPPPPPPPIEVIVVEQPPPPPPPRPRLAILHFAEIGDPDLIPPGLGCWTADNLAPYFSPPYEVVDSGEVFWWMRRLGLSVRDVATDPVARRWLGRALGVRFFLFGTLRQGGRLEAATHLVDAEYGWEYGTGRVRVHDPYELKLRLWDLARLTLMGPEERLRYGRDLEESEGLLVEARRRGERGEFSLALEFFAKARELRPDSIEVLVLFQGAQQRQHQAELEETGRRDWDRQQVLLAESRRRQWELARAADDARVRAEQEAAALTDARRDLLARQRDLARQQLVLQARTALRQNNFQVSVQLYESAQALKPGDETCRELAAARARAAEADRNRAAAASADREAARQRHRAAELTEARNRTEADRRRREVEEQTRRAAQELRDQAEQNRLVELAQKQRGQQKYESAVASLQSARRLRKSDEVDRLLGQALVEQARATARTKDEQAALERRLAEEKSKRDAAEAEARRKRESYTAALLGAQRALAEKHYDQALLKFQQAKLVYATDIVLVGLRQAEEGLARERAARDADQRRQADEAKKAAEFKRLQQEAKSALSARQYDRAVQSYREADRLVPGNADVLAGLTEAEHRRDEQATGQRRRQAEQAKEASFHTLLESGRANLAARQYEAAVAALSEAVKLKPDDAAAREAMEQAKRTRAATAADARTRAEQKNAAEYQKRMGEGRTALAARQYDAALASFREAQRLLPGDQTAAAFIKEAEKSKQAAAPPRPEAAKAQQDAEKAREAEAARKRAEEARLKAQQEQEQARRLAAAGAEAEQKKHQAEKAQQDARAAHQAEAMRQQETDNRRLDYTRRMSQGRAALGTRRYDEAVWAFTEALKLQPNDPAATQGVREATQAREASRPSPQPSPPKPPAPQPPAPPPPPAAQAEFNKHMAEGKRFATAHRFADAVKEYEAALKLWPGNPEATDALKRAREGKP